MLLRAQLRQKKLFCADFFLSSPFPDMILNLLDQRWKESEPLASQEERNLYFEVSGLNGYLVNGVQGSNPCCTLVP